MGTLTDQTQDVRYEPFGPTSRGRQSAAALVIMAGALPIAFLATTSYGRPPRLWSVILTIGVMAMLAWLVDGRRYLGVGTVAMAIGGAFTIAQLAEVQDYQFALIFGLLGVALLVVRAVNPPAVGASAGLLLFIATSATTFVSIERTSFPEAWFYVGLMIVWGAVQLVRARSGPSDRIGAPAPSDDASGARGVPQSATGEPTIVSDAKPLPNTVARR